MSAILITGAAGFIGHALALRMLGQGIEVVGLDNLNDYYDPRLKKERLAQLQAKPGFSFAEFDLVDAEGIDALFAKHGFKTVINLAAQAGVRYSLQKTRAYARSNLDGFLNVLEACRHHGTTHLLTPHRVRCTERQRACRSRPSKTSIIPSASMPRRRRRTS